MDNEDRLITDLINRYSVQIKFKKNQGYQTSDQLQQNVLRKHNEQTLIDLSSNKLNLIANGLSDILESLTKKKEKEEPNEHNLWAQSYTLGLLAKCMEHQWLHIKSQYREMSKTVTDETEALKLREKEEQLLPPPLQDSMASRILTIASGCLIRSPSDSETYLNSGRLIYQLSATNYDQVYSKIIDTLSAIVSASSGGNNPSSADVEAITNQLMLIEHINLDSHLLCELLERILKAISSFKKEKHQFTLAMVLRRAIWNWIENHPVEFVRLTRSGGRLSSAPDVLFDILDGWAKKTIHRNCIWPLMTMLLLLCPDLMIKIQRNEKHSNHVHGSGDLTLKKKFLDTLKKSMKVSKLSDVVSICYLDIFKASSYVTDDDITILKYFANLIEGELKDRFIIQQKGVDLESINLETDFLVTVFKVSSKKFSVLLPDLMHSESPSFRIVLLKSLIKIVMDDGNPNRLPWSPSLLELYPIVSTHLKQLFVESLQSVRSMPNTPRSSSGSISGGSGSISIGSSSNSKKNQDHRQFDIQLISLLVQLFNLDPKFIFFPLKTPAQDLDDVKFIMVGLITIASSTLSSDLIELASSTLIKLHQPQNIDAWYDKKLVNGFWEISSAINSTIGNALVDHRDLPLEHIQRLLILLHEIITCRNQYLYQARDSLLPQTSIRDVRSQGISKLEFALLVHLCSSEPDICLRSTIIFGLMCEEIDILGETAEDSNGIIINQSVYKKLATSCQSLHTGKKHQQKVIRSLLRRITSVTTGNSTAWEEIFSRWTATTPLLINISDDLNSDKLNGKKPLSVLKQEWYNMIGFLCSLCGVILNKETILPSNLSSGNLNSSNSSGGLGGIGISGGSSGNLGNSLNSSNSNISTSSSGNSSNSGGLSQGRTRSRKLTNTPTSQLEKARMITVFIDELIELMVSENNFIRDSTISMMGTAWCPSAIEYMLKQLHIEMSGCFVDANESNNQQERSNLFVDQTINVLKNIVEPSNLDELDPSNIGALERLLMIIIKLINQLQQTTSSHTTLSSSSSSSSSSSLSSAAAALANNQNIQKMKRNVCTLLEMIVGKKSNIQISIDFRRSLLDSLIEWTTIFAHHLNSSTVNLSSTLVNGMLSGNTLNSTSADPSNSSSDQEMKSIRDVDLLCIQLVSSILIGLVFSPNEINPGASPFKRYYNVFFNQLIKKQDLNQSEFNKQITDGIIQCICNMIQSNSNYDYFVQMGYHEDSETRAAFLQVISRVIKQYNLHQAEQKLKLEQQQQQQQQHLQQFNKNHNINAIWKPSSSITVSPSTSFLSLEENRYQQFYEILLTPDYHTVVAMSQINDSDELARVLVFFYDQYDKTLPALKKIIQYEISTTTKSSSATSTLLRGNSLASRMLASYIKQIGTPYLKKALSAPINKLLANNTSMEIDQTKLAPNEDIYTNISRLSLLAKMFVRSIQENISSVPSPIRELSAFISKELSQHHPGIEKLTVVGIMFVKYICPAIVSPQSFGIIPTSQNISQENRRALILITKILQKLGANGQQSAREPFMNGFNSFVNENSKLIDEVFDTLTSVSPDKSATSNGLSRSSPKLVWETKMEDIELLHSYFINSSDRLGKVLTVMGQSKLADEVQSVLKTLSLTLNSIQPIALTDGGSDRNAVVDLLTRFEHTNIDYLQQLKLFYQQGYTLKDKSPVFYYIVRRFDPSMDQDHLFYLMLKSISDRTDGITKDFTIVIDCTFSTPHHNIPLSWCATWLRHLPSSVAPHCSMIILNPSRYIKSHSRSIYKLVGQHHKIKMLLFLSNPIRLFDHIDSTCHGVPEATLGLESEIMAIYSPVTKCTPYLEKNVTLRISKDYLQIISIKLYSLLGRSTQLIDTYPISNIKLISNPLNSNNDNSISNNSNNNEEFEIRIKNPLTNINNNTNNNQFQHITIQFKSPQKFQIIQSINQSIASSNSSLNQQQSETLNVMPTLPHDIPGTLLNIGLLNLGSTNHSLRTAAYNVLSAIAVHPNFSSQCRLLDSTGLYVPKNDTQKIVQISTRLSKCQPELTLDFMLEALHGINKASVSAKYLVLEYMEPWISNLSLYTRKGQAPEQLTRYKKTIDIIDLLIELTIREVHLKPSIHEHIWISIGKQSEDLIGLVLQRCSLKSRETRNSEIIGEMVSSMGYTSPQPVGRKLIGRILKLLDKTAIPSTNTIVNDGDLSDHALWTQITINLRLLMYLMFDNPICAQLYLPEIFHIICTLFCIGSVNVGITVHTLLLNTLHSLYNSMVSNDGRLSAVPYLISQLGEQKFLLLFGINSASSLLANNDFNLSTESKELEKMSITNVDPVVKSIFSILKVFIDNRYEQAKQWHMRWIQLTVKAALTTNIAIQGRALITLGNIVKNNSICELLIRDILKVLAQSLKSPNALATHSDIIYSALHCITRLHEYLSPTKSATIFTSLFWISMSFVEIYDSKIFSVAIALLESLIKQMDQHQLFTDGFHPTLMQARKSNSYLKPLTDIDQIIGISFESNFSFAIATHLLKGIKNASTKSSTSGLLSTILKIVSKRPIETCSMLGYLAALLATEGEVPFIENQTEPGQILFNHQMIIDDQHASLLLNLLQTILTHTDREPELLLLFEILREGIKFVPQSFPTIHSNLSLKISSAISISDNPKIIEPALFIMDHLYSYMMSTPTTSISNHKQFDFKSIGFQGMFEAGQGFSRQSTLTMNQSILKSTSELLDITVTNQFSSIKDQTYPFNESDCKIEDISDDESDNVFNPRNRFSSK